MTKSFLATAACIAVTAAGVAHASENTISASDSLTFTAQTTTQSFLLSWWDAVSQKGKKEPTEYDGDYRLILKDTTTGYTIKEVHLLDGVTQDVDGVWNGSFAESFSGLTVGHKYKLTFKGEWDDVKTGGNWSITQNALVTAAMVPEPETYAMMLAGLGMIGFMARRRRS